jgi:hypothetical protein
MSRGRNGQGRDRGVCLCRCDLTSPPNQAMLLREDGLSNSLVPRKSSSCSRSRRLGLALESGLFATMSRGDPLEGAAI